MAFLTHGGLERRFERLQYHAWVTHPFYIEEIDTDRQPAGKPPHCYASSREVEAIGTILRGADSMIQINRELTAAQEQLKKSEAELSGILSALDLRTSGAYPTGQFDPSNLRELVPHEPGPYSYSSQLSGGVPMAPYSEVNDPAIISAVFESPGVSPDQALGVYEVPLGPATTAHAQLSGRAMQLDDRFNDLSGAAANTSTDSNTGIPTPNLATGVHTSTSLPISDAPHDSRPIPTDEEFTADMIGKLVQRLKTPRGSHD